MYEPSLQSDVQYVRDNQKINLLLPGEEWLDQIGFKALQHAGNSSLLCGYKSVFNGRLKLTYEISKYTSLAALLPQLGFDQLTGILCDLLDVVEQIYDIGFLRYENIHLQADDIFIDSSNYKVLLLYFPVKVRGQMESQAEFEQRLRQEVHRLLTASPLIMQARMHRLDSAFQSAAPLSELKHQMLERSGTGKEPEEAEQTAELLAAPAAEHQEAHVGIWQKFFGRRKGNMREARRTAVLRLVGEGTPEPVSIDLSEAEQVVGKNPQLGRCAVLFNRTISRRHCKFVVQEDGCFLVDLDSANGTFLNETRLTAQIPYPVKAGDRIRLSNSNFVLK